MIPWTHPGLEDVPRPPRGRYSDQIRMVGLHLRLPLWPDGLDLEVVLMLFYFADRLEMISTPPQKRARTQGEYMLKSPPKTPTYSVL